MPTVIGLFALLAGLYFTGQTLISTRQQSRATEDQVRLAEQGQYTDRFGKAVEQLGSDKIDVRLGAVYSLEYLVRDAPGYQPTVIDVISAFVRTHAPAGSECSPGQVAPAVDIQAAVTVIGRRIVHKNNNPELNLSRTCLPGADLGRGNFDHANLSYSQLGNAQLDHCSLREADFSGSQLAGARLPEADASFATFSRANLTDADLRQTILKNAIMNDTILKGVSVERGTRVLALGPNLVGANLTDFDLSGMFLVHADFTDANLYGVDLSKAILDGATFRHAFIVSANFTSASLKDADLASVDVGSLEFDANNANLPRQKPKFYAANLSNADLTNVDLSRVDLTGANLTGARGLR